MDPGSRRTSGDTGDKHDGRSVRYRAGKRMDHRRSSFNHPHRCHDRRGIHHATAHAATTHLLPREPNRYPHLEINPAEADALAEIKVAGYLLWSDLTCATLPHCLALALTSDITVISPTVGQALGDALRNMPPDAVVSPPIPETCPRVKFTARYREILLLVGTGLTNQAIADQLSISEHTVHTHLAEIYRRPNVDNRVMAAKVARQCGYLD